MTALTATQKIHYTLRVATAFCFIGHGSFGIITKAVWCNYFAVFGIGTDLAYKLMPWLGSFDILLGLMVLILPLRIIPVWLLIWGFITALCRPLSGEHFAEFIERTGNFGVPFVLLLLSGTLTKKNLLEPINPNLPATDKTLRSVFLCLKIIVFLLLTGHGWLNLLEKKSLLTQYSSLGFPNPATVALTVGLFEISAAVSVLIRPLRSLILILVIWKMGTELLYPHYEFFEWVERGGSYGALLSLWFILDPALTENVKRLSRKSKRSALNVLPFLRNSFSGLASGTKSARLSISASAPGNHTNL
ncbi:MAG: hypothetical protein ACHQDF_06065 [Chitinophagales bacterium]